MTTCFFLDKEQFHQEIIAMMKKRAMWKGVQKISVGNFQSSICGQGTHTHPNRQTDSATKIYYLLFIEVEGGIDIYGSVESGALTSCYLTQLMQLWF